MQSSGTAAFRCQTCGRELPVNLDRYPRAGGTFPCPSCRAPLTLPPIEEFLASLPVQAPEPPAAAPPAPVPPSGPSAAGSVPVPRPPSTPGMAVPRQGEPGSSTSAPEKAPAAAPPPKPPQTYRVYLQVGGTENMTRMEIWQAIRRGELGEATEVAPLGSDDWKPMTAYPELARLLDQQARSVVAKAVPMNAGVPAPMGRRFVAKLIDMLLLGIVFLPVQASIDKKLAREMESIQAEARKMEGATAPPSAGAGAPSYQPSYEPSGPRRPPGSYPMTQEEANRRQADAQWQRAQQMQREQQAREQQQEAERQKARSERTTQQLGERLLTVFGQVLWQATIMSLLSQFLFVVMPLALTGASVGKLAMGLRVRTPEGKDIGFGRALGRTAAEILSGCLLYIGYLMALFDDERRTLHDRIAGTRVEPK